MHNQELLDALRLVLKSLERRQADPGEMFKQIEPLCRSLGIEKAIIYFDDVYPDRMRRVFSYGDYFCFPEHVVREDERSLLDTFRGQSRSLTGLVSARLRNHGRELGVFAGVLEKGAAVPDEFDILVHFLSLMAFVERGRRNYQIEREEREIFFAQALASRVLFQHSPQVDNLRLDVQFTRSIESSGDFFDFIPNDRGGLFGMIGCCNGRGLQTTLEMTSIMREIHRSREGCRNNLADILLRVNDLLLRQRRRAHQASVCLFEVDVGRRRLHMAKAGRLGIALGGRKTGVENISASGGLFLGLMEKPAIQNETFDFSPGQGLLCVTEGFYSNRKGKAQPQLRWFLQAVENAVEFRNYEKVSLAKAMIANLENAVDHSPESMLTLSVEFLSRAKNNSVGKKTGK